MLQVGRQQQAATTHHITPSVVNSPSIGHHQPLATLTTHQSQLVAGQLVPSLRASPQVAQQVRFLFFLHVLSIFISSIQSLNLILFGQISYKHKTLNVYDTFQDLDAATTIYPTAVD